jgi:hypothetical protein
MIRDPEHNHLVVNKTNDSVEEALKKLEMLASNDKEMIQLQRKTIYVQ